MIDFAPLQALGPLAQIDEPRSSVLIHYLDHYRLTPLLRDNVGLYAGFVDTGQFRLWAQVWSPGRRAARLSSCMAISITWGSIVTCSNAC